jgi:hypothetical protein
MRQYWVFTVGTRDEAPPIDWLAQWSHHVDEMWFPGTKRPVAVQAGDRAVIYGSQGRGFVAAAEVMSTAPESNDDPRWPWKLKYRLLAAKAADYNVASPDAAGIDSARVVRGPHTRISEAEYHRAVAAMLQEASASAA